MRRNILTYKALPNNEGYDLICIHPDPRKKGSRVVRVQVKSRYQTDCDRSVIVHKKTLAAFDFLIAVFLNVGNFYRKAENSPAEKREPEFFTLPAVWVKQHQDRKSSWGKLSLRRQGIDRFKNDKGFEQIADALGVAYPTRPRRTSPQLASHQRPITDDLK